MLDKIMSVVVICVMLLLGFVTVRNNFYDQQEDVTPVVSKCKETNT